MRPPGRHSGGAARRSWTGTVVILLVAVVYLLPLQWMLTTSLAPSGQALSEAGQVLPTLRGEEGEEPLSPAGAEYWSTLADVGRDNYLEVWTSRIADFPLYLKNTLIVSVLSVIGMVVSSAIVAFGFARLRWPGRDATFLLVLATMMIPFPAIMAPMYILFKHLGWIGSFKPLWVPTFFGGAFSIFLLRQFFLTIPRALDEAAMIDGCSTFGIFWRIVLPLSRPALAVVALFQCIASWNDFVGPLIFLNHEEKYTLALGLFMYQSQHGGTPWNLVMAASILVIVPVVVLFLFCQRFFVEGIATRGIKG
ncbi:MAG: carbohydrate ABC transporter permease [Planctomycetota bacterium]|jgi:multiple sugar transport system permease protein